MFPQMFQGHTVHYAKLNEHFEQCFINPTMVNIFFSIKKQKNLQLNAIVICNYKRHNIELLLWARMTSCIVICCS